MNATGVIVNGRVELNEPDRFPEGAKVWVELSPPGEDHDYETELAILRESHAEALAGKGIPFLQAMRELSVKHGMPPMVEE